jgi:hypothetical protein
MPALHYAFALKRRFPAVASGARAASGQQSAGKKNPEHNENRQNQEKQQYHPVGYMEVVILHSRFCHR